jgi:phage baseplate assembly protein gpV
MSGIVEIIRKVVESELKKLYFTELGIVTSIFPHESDSDKDNYECNVKLKYKDLELRKVPVATQHIGLANIPKVGDLVLLSFINGNINAPIVIGRLYNDEDRPPVNQEEEIVYIPPYSKNADLRRFHLKLPSGLILTIQDEAILIEAGKTKVVINQDGNVELESNAKFLVKATGDMEFSASNIKMETQQNIEIKAGANANFESSASMGIKAGANADIEASAPLNLKGAIVNIN